VQRAARKRKGKSKLKALGKVNPVAKGAAQAASLFDFLRGKGIGEIEKSRGEGRVDWGKTRESAAPKKERCIRIVAGGRRLEESPALFGLN